MMGLRVFQKPHRNHFANPLPANLASAAFHPFDKHLILEHQEAVTNEGAPVDVTIEADKNDTTKRQAREVLNTAA